MVGVFFTKRLLKKGFRRSAKIVAAMSARLRGHRRRGRRRRATGIARPAGVAVAGATGIARVAVAVAVAIAIAGIAITGAAGVAIAGVAGRSGRATGGAVAGI